MDDIFNRQLSLIKEIRKSLEDTLKQMNCVNDGFKFKVDVSNLDDFKQSIEEFQKKNPNAKIKASAYAYSIGEEPKVFSYESKEEVPKLEMKTKSKKIKKKKEWIL